MSQQNQTKIRFNPLNLLITVFVCSLIRYFFPDALQTTEGVVLAVMGAICLSIAVPTLEVVPLTDEDGKQ